MRWSVHDGNKAGSISISLHGIQQAPTGGVVLEQLPSPAHVL